jgi:thioredoxin-like negative regulator of GroEL
MINEPVLIVGCLPGASKGASESYAKANDVKVPLYVDADRSFEKKLIAMKVLGQEISLRNVMAAFLADGKGVLQERGFGKPDAAIKELLPTARWKVPPAEIAEPLKPAWRAMEFGQMGVAAPLIAQALKARDEKVKACAETLSKAIKTQIETSLAEAKTKADAGEKWAAYKILLCVATDYKDFPESRAAATEMSKLRSDKVVAKEVQARAALDNILAQMAKSRGKQEQSKQYLQQLIQQFPDTEAAAQAKNLL